MTSYVANLLVALPAMTEPSSLTQKPMLTTWHLRERCDVQHTVLAQAGPGKAHSEFSWSALEHTSSCCIQVCSFGGFW